MDVSKEKYPAMQGIFAMVTSEYGRCIKCPFIITSILFPHVKRKKPGSDSAGLLPHP